MNKKIFGTILIFAGVFGLFAAILVDIIRTGTLAIQAAQILVIELSLLSIGLGILFRQLPEQEDAKEKPFLRFSKWLSELPMVTWVLAGFLIAYFAFFIMPMFFSLPPRMLYFNKYLPDRFPIGNDLILLVDLIKQWFTIGQSPFYVQFYPPFTYVLLSPFVLVGDYHTLYKLVTVITLVSFVLSSLIIPLLINVRRDALLIVLFFVLGLFSYGMQFELERGQVNVLAFLFAMSAIYIFHRHYAFRRFAYALFSIAVQLKIYPAIFIVMLVRDWRDWKGNLRRAVVLGLFNFALLFVTGIKPFLEFMDSVTMQLKTPGWAWEGNHSIQAFVSVFVERQGFGAVSPGILEFIQGSPSLISNVFLAIFLLCFLSALYRAYQRNQQGFDPFLFLISTLGALIIPVSNDYTLSILAAPAALAFTTIVTGEYGRNKPAAIVLLFLASLAYSATLYPFKYKAPILQNLFPSLFILLIAVTLLNHIAASPKKENTEPPAC